MLDKQLFDRNAFDRSVSSDGITLNMLGSSQVQFHLTVKTPVTNTIIGAGVLTSNIQMHQNVANAFEGIGSLTDVVLVLKRSTTIPLKSEGAFGANIIVKTPLTATLKGTSTVAVDSRMIMNQHMKGSLSGEGSFAPQPIFGTSIGSALYGSGHATSKLNMLLPLVISQRGEGVVTLRRIGGLNENFIELIDINLLPGQTITIDTDLLQVLLGSVEDVSAVTTESVFFELNPGENEIIINSDSGDTMDVITIWQNRWL